MNIDSHIVASATDMHYGCENLPFCHEKKTAPCLLDHESAM